MTAPTLSAAILAVKGATEGEWSAEGSFLVGPNRESLASFNTIGHPGEKNAAAIVAAVNWLKSDEPKELLQVLLDAREVVGWQKARFADARNFPFIPDEHVQAEHARLTALLHRIDRLTAAGGEPT